MRSFLAVCLLIGVVKGSALAGPGSCQNFDFPTDSSGRVDWPHSVKVIQEGTPVYQEADSFSAISTLSFNKSLRVLDVQGDRVQAGHVTTLAPIGWVERSNLLCAVSALKGKSGLEQKLYIQTATEMRGENPTSVKVYPSSGRQGCNGQCREISGFEGYFVFDVDKVNNSYLLSETYHLDDVSQLVGWVNGNDGFIWDTAYGLRPKEKLVFPEDHPLAGVERIVCAYTSPEEAINQPVERCLPIRGGERWFLSEHRIPLLGRVEYGGQSFYKVLVFFTGIPFANPAIGQEHDNATLEVMYIPVSVDIVEDVWLKSNDLDTWISLLREFDSPQLSQLFGAELRQAFVNAIKEGLEKIIRNPLYTDTGEPLKEYLQRQDGLPVRDDSPLFRYSINELMDPDAVIDCEIVRLLLWVNHTKQMLNIVYHGDLRPVYTVEEFPGECPSGEDIPFIVGDIQSAPLGSDPNMRYNHNFQKANIYWVPKEFLP